ETTDLEGFRIICKRLRCAGLDRLFGGSFARYAANQVDLDQSVPDQEAGRTDGRARWRGLEILLPHLIEAGEIVEIGEEDLRLENIVERLPAASKVFLRFSRI